MVPAQYQVPAAALVLLGGIVACFFGYRLFRIVLAIIGCIIGGLLASSIFGASDTGPMVVAAVVGALLGAGVLMAAYFVGVAIMGAVLGALAANLTLSAGDRDPHFLIIMFAAVIGAVVAIYLQRYFIIVGTGFVGAWFLIVGAMALIGDQTTMAVADVWVAYPLDPAPGQRWIPIAWMVLGLIGVGVQMGVTAGEKGRIARKKAKPKSD